MKTAATPEDKRAIAEIAARCRYDPLLWAEVAWRWGEGELAGKDIRVWQAEVLDTIAEHLANPATRYTPLRIAVASGHGIGKSAGMGMLSNWAMSCWRGARIVCTANTENQLRTKTSPEIGTWFKRSISAPLFSVDTMSIKLRDATDDAWALDFAPWSENNTEAFAGLHAEGRLVMLLMDEASAISDKIFEVAEGALTDENTILIWVVFGNPTRNTGRFRECFRRFRRYWKTWQIDSRTVEGTNKQYLQSLVDMYGEDSDRVKVRVRGIFPSASSRQLIPSPVIDTARGRHLPPSAYDFAPVILTCDPAWTGDDDLVIGMRQGLKADILEVIPKNDNDFEIAGRLARYEDKLNAAAVFIDFGYGTGIKSAGDTMGRHWELVNFGGKAPEPGYQDMRAYMYDKMLDWLEKGGAIPDDQVLCDEMQAIETLPTLDGRLKLMSKEDMRKADGDVNSPDRADCIALSFARPVVRRDAAQSGHRGRVARSKYLDENGEYNPNA